MKCIQIFRDKIIKAMEYEKRGILWRMPLSWGKLNTSLLVIILLIFNNSYGDIKSYKTSIDRFKYGHINILIHLTEIE